MKIFVIMLMIILVGACLHLSRKIKQNKLLFNDQLQQVLKVSEEQTAAMEDIIYEKERSIKELEQAKKIEAKFQRNKGEVITHHLLLKIKQSLVNEGRITHDQMMIMGNEFVPDSRGKILGARQIDHLVLLPTGVYIIETKHWRGKILYDYTKNDLGEFSYLFDMMFPEVEDHHKKTLVIRNSKNPFSEDSSKDAALEILSYGDPALQVRSTAQTLQTFLKDKVPSVQWVKGILYFGYKQDQINSVHKKNTDNENPLVICNEKELEAFFQEELKKPEKLSQYDILKITQLIRNVNDLSS